MIGVWSRAGAIADAATSLGHRPRVVTLCAGDEDLTVRFDDVHGRGARIDVYGDGGSVLVASAPGTERTYHAVADDLAAQAIADWLGAP